MWACPVFARLGRRIFSGTWSTVYCRRHSGGGNWTTGITMATRGWTWLVLYWLSCSEGEGRREGGKEGGEREGRRKGGREEGREGRREERGREGGEREGRRREGGREFRCTLFLYFRLFRNLTKEVRLYAQKFIDKGRVSE